MTSRERVRAVLEHREPDRVPVDLWGSACRILTEEYLEIIKQKGLPVGELVRPGSTTQYVDLQLADLVECDFRHINIKKAKGFFSYVDEKGNTIDEWGIGRKLIAGYNGITFHPFEDLSEDQLDKHKWPDPADPGRIEGIAQQAKDWYENTNFAITATSAVSGALFENCQYLCGTENFLAALYEEPEFVDKLVWKLTEVITETYIRYLEPISTYVEWVEFTEDLAMQNSLMLSPDMFRRFFKQPHIEMFGTIKKRFPNVKIWFHSCGALRPLISDLIDCGIDILNPLQPHTTGMVSEELKKEFGNQVVFHGGIDIQYAMPGTVEQVKEEVKKRINAYAPGGGYILASSNHIQSDVPVENFFKLYEFAHQYGHYPINVE